MKPEDLENAASLAKAALDEKIRDLKKDPEQKARLAKLARSLAKGSSKHTEAMAFIASAFEKD